MPIHPAIAKRRYKAIMRFHFHRVVKFVFVVINSLIVVYILNSPTMTSMDTYNVVLDSRLVAMTVTSGNDAVNWTSPTSTAGARTPTSVRRLSTLVPSFRHRGHKPFIDRCPALRVANFSPNTNEWYRENFVVRLSPQLSNTGVYE